MARHLWTANGTLSQIDLISIKEINDFVNLSNSQNQEFRLNRNLIGA